MARTVVEIEVDQTLVDEIIERFGVRDTREAVNLALRALVHDSDAEEFSLEPD
jgi:Arc/MetJ family transcription regulator